MTVHDVMHMHSYTTYVNIIIATIVIIAIYQTFSLPVHRKRHMDTDMHACNIQCFQGRFSRPHVATGNY